MLDRLKLIPARSQTSTRAKNMRMAMVTCAFQNYCMQHIGCSLLATVTDKVQNDAQATALNISQCYS